MEDISITKRILLYIEDNMDLKLSLEKIAEDLNYSKFYIARTFKNNTGMTLYKYIRGRRLDEAARKLAETNQPIVEVAFEAGYSSQQAFTQAFRCVYAHTPQEYRRRGIFIPAGNGSGACVSIHLTNAARVKAPADCCVSGWIPRQFAGRSLTSKRGRIHMSMGMKYAMNLYRLTGGRVAA